MTFKEARKQKNWSSDDVAAYLGVSPSTIRAIETGDRYPSYPLLCRIEKLFALSHDELLTLKPKNTP